MYAPTKMAIFDQLPADMRALANEYGLNAVLAYSAQGRPGLESRLAAHRQQRQAEYGRMRVVLK